MKKVFVLTLKIVVPLIISIFLFNFISGQNLHTEIKHYDSISSSGDDGIKPFIGSTYSNPAPFYLVVLKPIGLWFVMILGIFANTLFEKVSKLKEDEDVQHLKLIKNTLKSKSFFQASLISLLIMYTTYNIMNVMPNNGTAYLYSFQSGFFWLQALNTYKAHSQRKNKIDSDSTNSEIEMQVG